MFFMIRFTILNIFKFSHKFQ